MYRDGIEDITKKLQCQSRQASVTGSYTNSAEIPFLFLIFSPCFHCVKPQIPCFLAYTIISCSSSGAGLLVTGQLRVWWLSVQCLFNRNKSEFGALHIYPRSGGRDDGGRVKKGVNSFNRKTAQLKNTQFQVQEVSLSQKNSM